MQSRALISNMRADCGHHTSSPSCRDRALSLCSQCSMDSQQMVQLLVTSAKLLRFCAAARGSKHAELGRQGATRYHPPR